MSDDARGPSAASGAAPVRDADEFQPLPQRQVVLTMAGVMLGIFLASLDQTVVGTAMPRMIAELGGLDRFTWVATAYLVASTTIVPIVGKLSDNYGRRVFYIVGIGVFLGGSVLAGLSQTMNQLIFFRALQGVGGGVMMANAFISIADLFPPAERGKYQGLVAAVFGFSSVIGPTLGGFLTDALSWRWIFYVNIPLGVPIIILFIRYFPNVRRHDDRPPRIDYVGMVLLVVAVVPLLVGMSWGGVQYGWTSPQIITAFVVSVVAAILFVVVELRVPEPIMPLTIYRNRVVVLSLIAISLTGFGMFGAIIFIPLFFQAVLGTSATSSGSFLTPMMLGMVVAAAVSGQVLSRFGGHYRLQGLVGTALMTAGALLISRMSVETSYTQAVVNIVILGLGLGATFPVFTIAIQNAVPYRVVGAATSATQFYRSIGGTLGLAVLGAVMAKRFGAALAASLPAAVTEAIPAEMLSRLGENPQALVSPEALGSLQASLGSAGASLLQPLLQGLRVALASAIGDVFVISMVVTALAFLTTLFLRGIPLKQRGAAAAPPPAADGAGLDSGPQPVEASGPVTE